MRANIQGSARYTGSKAAWSQINEYINDREEENLSAVPRRVFLIYQYKVDPLGKGLEKLGLCCTRGQKSLAVWLGRHNEDSY
jgi:hypothetical protein